MNDKKKQSFSPKKLQELERQAREFTEDDYLKEAEALEQEMADGNIHFEVPENFFEQVLAKGKLIEAERAPISHEPASQDITKAAEDNVAEIWAASVPQDAEPIRQVFEESMPVAAMDMGVEKKAESKPTAVAEMENEPEPPTVVAAAWGAAKAEDIAEEKLEQEKLESDVPEIEVSGIKVIENEAVKEAVGDQGGKKPKRKTKLRWKMLLVAAALVVMPLAFGITSGGKKLYQFEEMEREGEGEGQHIALNNDDHIDYERMESDAYYQIENEIGVCPLKIGDRPYEFKFQEHIIAGRKARIQFVDSMGGYFTEIVSSSPYKAVADYANDGEFITYVHNDWIDMDINIYGEVLENRTTKYYAKFTIDDSVYLLYGDILIEDFKMILIDMKF